MTVPPCCLLTGTLPLPLVRHLIGRTKPQCLTLTWRCLPVNRLVHEVVLVQEGLPTAVKLRSSRRTCSACVALLKCAAACSRIQDRTLGLTEQAIYRARDNVCPGQPGVELWRVVLGEQSLREYARDASAGRAVRHDAQQAFSTLVGGRSCRRYV